MKLLGYLGMVVLSQLAGCANDLPRAGTQVPLRVSAHFPENAEDENLPATRKQTSLMDNFGLSPLRGLSLNLGEVLSTTEPVYSPEKLVDGGEARFASKRALRWFNYRISGSAGVLSSGSTEISDRSQEELEAIEVKVPAGDTIQIEMSFLQMDQLVDDPEALCRSGLPVFARSWVATESVTPRESGEVAVTFREAGRSTLHMAALKIPSTTLKTPSPTEWKFGLRDNITGAVLEKEFCPAELLPSSNFASDSALVRLPTFALPLKAHHMMVFGPDFKASVDTNNPIQPDFFAGLSSDSAVRASEVALRLGITAVMEFSYANRDNWGIARTSISAILPKTAVSTNMPPQFLSSAVLNAPSLTAPLELTYDLLARNFPGRDDSTQTLGYMITSLENSLGTLYRIVNGNRVSVTVPTTLMPADVVFWEPPSAQPPPEPLLIFKMRLVDKDLAVSENEAAVMALIPSEQSNTPPRILTSSTNLATVKDIPMILSAQSQNSFSVSDAESSRLSVTLAIKNGLLSLNGSSGLTFASGSERNEPMIEFSGSQSDINAALNGLTYSPNSGFLGTDILSIRVVEADVSAPAIPLFSELDIIVYVNDVVLPQPPTLMPSGTSVTFVEKSAAVAIDPSISVTDSDSTQLSAVSVTISNGYTSGDSLSCSEQTNISCSFDSGNGELMLTGSASLAAYQDAIRSISYKSTSSHPSQFLSSRIFTWVASDGLNGSFAVTTYLSISAVNDPPILSGGQPSYNYEPNSGTVAPIGDGLILADEDNDSLFTAAIELTQGYTVGDVLAHEPDDKFSFVLTGNKLLISSSVPTQQRTLEEFKSVLNAISFSSTSTAASTRTVAWMVNDGEDDSNILEMIINVSPNSKGLNITPAATSILLSEDGSGSLNFTVGNLTSTVQCSQVLATSDNSELFTSSGIIITGGTSSACTLALSPSFNQWGNANIQLLLSFEGEFVSQTVTASVIAINDAPVNGVVASQTADEDSNLSVFGMSVTDPEASMLKVTLSVNNGALSLNDTSGLSFMMGDGMSDASMVFIGTIAELNTALQGLVYQSNQNFFGNDTLMVVTSDEGEFGTGGTLTDTDLVNITILAVNEAPVDVALSATNINENMVSGSTIGILSSTDVDAGNTFTYSVGGTDAASFAISSGMLVSAASFNYETKSSYSITLTTIDQGGLALTKPFTIIVNDVNEAPTDLALSAASIHENRASGSAVGTLSSTDVDAANTFTHSLGGTDAASFAISSGMLVTAASFNYEAKNSYSITVTTTDQGLLSFTKNFTITVNDVNEAPTDLALTVTSINENMASGSPVGVLSTIDTDAGDLFSYSLSGADASSFTVAGSTLKTTAIFNFETKNSYVITVTTSDQGGLAFTKNFTISVNNVNDAPTGLVYCDTLLSGHVFRTGPANGSNWSIGSCGGALDEDGDALTYYLSSPTATDGYSCPAPMTATVSGGSIGFSGAFPTNIAGSCGYKLKACDTNSSCTSLSTNSIIISSYTLSFDMPTITLSPTCQLVASAPVNMSSNVSGFSVSGSLGSDFGSQTVAMNSSSGIFTTSFYLSDLSDSQFKNTFSLGALPAASTRVFALTYTVTSGNLSSLSGITIPSGQVMSPAQSTSYSLAVMPEALEPRTNSPNSDGLQPEFASTTSVCRRCNSQNPVVISGGGEHTCLVESGSILKCWGRNLENQLGDGTTLGKGIPTEILVTNDPRRIVATGSMSTCLVSDSLLNSGNQQLRCWGRIPSSYDTGTTSTNFTFQSTAQSGSVLMMNARPIHSVAVSKTSDARGDHYCAIVDSDRKVMCWGNNTSRQAGSSGDQVQPMPVQAGLLSGSTYLLGVQSVATGSTHTCAANSGGVYCWGSGFNGVTGQTPYTSAMLISGLSSTQISQLAAGSNFTCALSADGAVKCWGANTSGQLGNNTTGGMTPSTVTGLDGIAGNQAVAITAGHSHACALKKDGTVLCWGNNGVGQLGMGTNSTMSQQPALVQFGAQGPLEKVVAISAGAMHTCAVSMDGSTACWGKNSSGQLGFNSNTDTNAAALVYWDGLNTTANSSLRPQMCSTISR